MTASTAVLSASILLRLLRVATVWVRTPAGGLAVLILATLAARLLFAAALGLGIDESYMVAAGRRWQLSYFDHPPIAWWLAWAAAHLAGGDAAIVVRLPFILLFALSTVLMYRLTAALFDARAGLWAAGILNAAPVLGITTATWVLPDGPLVATLLGAAWCLVGALPARGAAAWGWWLATGGCAGLALSSKYSAALTILGALIYLLSEPEDRRWLRRPQPYVAGLAALVLFLPALVWNARHGWVSFLFQGGRAGGRFDPLGPLAALGGAALYFLPWIWLPLLLCGADALRRGPSDRGRWLLFCLAAPPIGLFTVVALWSRVLPHWAAPGYLMLVPLLGAARARRAPTSRAIRVTALATAVIVVLGTGFVAGAVRYDWLARPMQAFFPGRDPSMAAVDWSSLRGELTSRGLLGQPRLAVAAIRWLDAGKIDYALGGRAPVLCLGPDPREYGIVAPLADYAGWDVLIVAPHTTEGEIAADYGRLFQSIEPLRPASVLHAGRPALSLPLFLGRGLRPPTGDTAGNP